MLKIFPGLNVIHIQPPLRLGSDPSGEAAALVHSEQGPVEYHIVADDYQPPFYNYAFKTPDFIVSYFTLKTEE
jgi:hypothetical protein